VREGEKNIVKEEHQHNSKSGGQGPVMGRRRLITYLLGFSVVSTLVGVLTPILGYLWPTSRVSAGTSEPVRVGASADFPAGKGEVVSVNDKPVIVVNTAQAGLKAFSAICTHLGCIVEWDTNRGIIACPCHGARFNPVNGAVISGPAPSPLPEFKLTVKDDAVYVSQG
jgi:cytochrome b6-f complex iron-sulfur subunit